MTSVTSIVRDRVRRISPSREFTTLSLLSMFKKLHGKKTPVKVGTLSVILSRMVLDSELVRVRQGVYRRGKP